MAFQFKVYLIEPKQCRGNFHHYYRHYQQNNNDNSNINNNDNNNNNSSALENVKTIKRFQLFNEKQQFNDFLNELKKHFENFSFEKYKLKYKDNENDWIEISNENDWKVALELFYNNQQVEPIRIQLIQTSNNQFNHSHHHHFGHQQHPCHGFRFGNNGSCFGGRRGPFGCHNLGGLFNFEKLFENLNTNNSGSNNNCNNLFENIANIVDTLFKDISNDNTNNNEQQEKKENNNQQNNSNNKDEEEIVVDEFLYGDEDKQNNVKEEESKQQKEEENKANVDNSKKYKLTLPPHIQLPPFIEPLLSQFNQLPKEKQENLLTLARNFFPLIDQFITEDNVVNNNVNNNNNVGSSSSATVESKEENKEEDEIKDDNVNYPSINNEEQQVPFFNPFNASNGFGNNNGGLPAMFQNFMNNFQQSNVNNNVNNNNTQLRDFTQELEQLENMGFRNREYNLNLLQKYNGNLELVLNNLLSENQF